MVVVMVVIVDDNNNNKQTKKEGTGFWVAGEPDTPPENVCVCVCV